MSLYDHLVKKNPTGIPYEEAKRLFLRLYCTLGILPEPLRHSRLGKKELAHTFAKLALECRLTGDQKLVAEEGTEQTRNPSEEAHWEKLADDLMHKKINSDWVFNDNSSNFV